MFLLTKFSIFPFFAIQFFEPLYCVCEIVYFIIKREEKPTVEYFSIGEHRASLVDYDCIFYIVNSLKLSRCRTTFADVFWNWRHRELSKTRQHFSLVRSLSSVPRFDWDRTLFYCNFSHVNLSPSQSSTSVCAISFLRYIVAT